MLRQANGSVVSGHILATEIGHKVLEAGGNAIDAGVATGLALSVLESIQVQFAGVAPILIREGASGRIVSIAGLGPWPKTTDSRIFELKHKGRIPAGVLRTVVPAAPDAWITALRLFGTMSFAEVAAPAIRIAREGFPAHGHLAMCSRVFMRHFRRYPDNAHIWLSGGQPVKEGDLFVQAELAATIQFMADEDQAVSAKHGRLAGLAAARDAFYVGDIGDAIVRHVQGLGGWLAGEDMAAFRSPVVEPVAYPVHGTTIYACGPWSQGPVLPMALNILHSMDIGAMEHNSSRYVHTVLEAVKLAYADREKFIGDPEHVSVPLAQLVDPAYGQERSTLINPGEAWRGMPPPGDIPGFGGSLPAMQETPSLGGTSLDTSVCCAIDRHGNMLSATPSDLSIDAPVVPGLGVVPSTRGAQSYVLAGHSAAVEPGRRPRMTASPFMAISDDGGLYAAGGPGSDAQPQAMLQVLLNHFVVGMDLQQAVAAPRFYSSSFPGTSDPHLYFPGRVLLDEGMPAELIGSLNTMGHQAVLNTSAKIDQAMACIASFDPVNERYATGVDPRLKAAHGT